MVFPEFSKFFDSVVLLPWLLSCARGSVLIVPRNSNWPY